MAHDRLQSLPVATRMLMTAGILVLVVLPVAGGDAVDVTKGMDADCPSKPFGGAEEYTFTPDSTGLVFSARDAGRQEAWSTNFDLYHTLADGSEKPKKLTANPAWDTQPVFSPDGKSLAYLAMSRAGYESDKLRIMVRGWDHRSLTARGILTGWPLILRPTAPA